MAYGDFEDLARRTASDEDLRYKAFNVAKNLRHDGYQRGLSSMVYKFFDKKSTGSGIANEPNYQQQMNFINQLLENLKKEKLFLDLKIMFWVLI